jgi:hypothetical protein
MEVSLESEEQHSQRELRPISLQSGLEAKQTSLPHGDILYSSSAVTEDFFIAISFFILHLKRTLLKLSFKRKFKQESKRVGNKLHLTSKVAYNSITITILDIALSFI